MNSRLILDTTIANSREERIFSWIDNSRGRRKRLFMFLPVAATKKKGRGKRGPSSVSVC
jgi:hypothetical protein